ncbi:Imm26 family immunity protein [Novosphingobium resinovorum]
MFKEVGVGQKVIFGDVFLITLDGERYGIGQLAGDWKGELYVVIFDKVVSSNASSADIDDEPLLFAAVSLDANLHHGDWRIIGNRASNVEALPQPWFKVNVEGRTFVEARDRSVTRPAAEAEAASLRLRTVVAPVRLENAIKAISGICEWQPRFEELRADYAISSADLLQRG